MLIAMMQLTILRFDLITFHYTYSSLFQRAIPENKIRYLSALDPEICCRTHKKSDDVYAICRSINKKNTISASIKEKPDESHGHTEGIESKIFQSSLKFVQFSLP